MNSTDASGKVASTAYAPVPAKIPGVAEGKRVSWVELYLDLVFVLAIGQIAHLIVAAPEMHSVWVAFGLFFASSAASWVTGQTIAVDGGQMLG